MISKFKNMTEKQDLLHSIDCVIERMQNLTEDEKIEVINEIKIKLHDSSPFKSEPVDCVLWVKNDNIKANDYNPNNVAPPEMESRS